MVFELTDVSLEALAGLFGNRSTIALAGHEYDIVNCTVAADDTVMKINLVISSHDERTAAAFQITGVVVRQEDPAAQLREIYKRGLKNEL